ncbi:sodium-translocating pyrophosphatase [Candidatus Berkelbacteria bacterium CG_4_10_14_0_8_um_filter_35_9_33_8]|uniref:K(+)-insensitive pyrophosphate-energized proton pump n=1 Tax=Candidatus Berkelbacteria bacterium CG_4_10_14_0_2_um_filter_35_9_33_12 TaxID=1974499 RepID=A0A2M7W547_9BACT|nr:MAG: sodium-translocating pyrophosphatase [Candidatus Berkelbacteria bacterium CG23_combo_of_CG06-09_8_20_14_all_33_15]PIS08449.1 MAG: sodium-translocating pyrophosphatase [Candidatus Berkelbacteria bacterium CG10_big_fil_rev_8_21_14_0_10_33_10]PIZ28539.1 MAG: sodium-translocating pyrophosphatase [Candidatus Berkelbacteria bacterium CG_4_10_14_0_8_um_filter_35_9_33_8]PJA20896.1 MAG: sodium-translocating pyrophosphatase [Candidatus Berkelbacteria bacterium CG_4_10_14_0_2_um_filter_35_9_33_12]
MSFIDFSIYAGIITGTVSILYGVGLALQILRKDCGSQKLQEIAQAIQVGANAYMKRQTQTLAIVAVIVFALIWWQISLISGIGFLLGAVLSALAGIAGMFISVRTNLRVAHIASKGLPQAFALAFKGGSVTGLLVVGLALFGISIFYYFTRDLTSMIGFALGGSLISIFARLGGGIYTKAADVGADLVGKVEANIPEDDPRNPATIADNVGDNVGDCAGMAADLFETYGVTAVATMLLGGLIFGGNEEVIVIPLFLGSIAIIGSIIGTWFVSVKSKAKIMSGMYRGLMIAGLISALGFWFFASYLSNQQIIVEYGRLEIFYPMIVGILVTAGIFALTDYYTSKEFGPVKSIALASTTGHGTNIISGLALSMKSTVLPVILIAIGIFLAYYWADLYGVALAAFAMLSLTGIVVAIDAFGPITDNAGGLAEMAGLPQKTRTVTDALDAVGNTTKAITKGFAIASAGLAALVLFVSYTAEIDLLGKKLSFDLSNHLVIIGLFIGGMLPYLFGAKAMEAVGKTASAVVEEVRRQFKVIPGIMTGKAKPDYQKAVDIVTKSALKQMIVPALIPVIAPILVGFLLGAEALGGMLVGSIVTGIFIAISMTTGGAAWDNAKKLIEDGKYGGKGSEAHKAAVTGDTVGDPYKDTAGPAINPMIKILNIVALLIVKLIIK